MQADYARRFAQAVQAGMDAAAKARGNMSELEYARHRLRERIAQGRSTLAQREYLQAMESADAGITGTHGPGRQIRQDELPPGMRGNGIVLDHARHVIAMAERGMHVSHDQLQAARSILAKAGA